MAVSPYEPPLAYEQSSLCSERIGKYLEADATKRVDITWWRSAYVTFNTHLRCTPPVRAIARRSSYNAFCQEDRKSKVCQLCATAFVHEDI
jgi:hypothetical protein